MTRKITVLVEKQPGEKNYSATMQDDIPGVGILGFGKDPKSAIDDFYIAIDDVRSVKKEMGEDLPEFECSFIFDLPSYFAYNGFLNVNAVARHMGINESLMRAYALGLKRPRKQRLEQIKDTIRQIGLELASPAICTEL